MNRHQLREIIESTLKEFDHYYSLDAVNLLMGTSAQESHLGEFIRQLGGGPALGIFQMEPATFQDIIDNFLSYDMLLYQKVKQVCNVQILTPECLKYNLKVAIIFCRFHYYRKPGRLPSSIEGMAAYWKRHYNTPLGAGTEDEFIANYKRYVA